MLRAPALATALLTSLVLAAPAVAAPVVRMDQVQAVGTHNSFKRELPPAESAELDRRLGVRGFYDLFYAYSHVSLREQLARQRARGLELDLWPDPQGGLYAHPLTRRWLDLPPLEDPAWRRPGTKVMHIADVDWPTSCVELVACLRAVRAWSRANPRHAAVPILLELKASEPRAVELGGVVAPAWDAAALDRLDQEIRSVFRRRELLVPDDVRRRGRSLERSVRRRGWPSVASARGKVLFLLDNPPGPIRDAYRAGRPSLQGRVLFTNSEPGQPDAAFVKRNDPTGANRAAIARLVRRGYLVRTQADVALGTVRSGSTGRRADALASGAQVVSTDFPAPGMSARYGTGYAVRLPRGLAVRCNPVSAPPGCRSRALERR